MAGSSVAARRAMDAAQHAAAQAFAGFAEDLRGTDDVLRELANTDDLTTVTSLALALDASELSLPPILATVAPQLLGLDLRGSRLPSLRDLGSSLSHLRVLWVTRTCLASLDGLSSVPALEELYAAFNDVTDLSPLFDLEHLVVVDIEANNVDDLNAVGFLGLGCPQLRHVSFTGNPLAADTQYRRRVVHALPAYLETLDGVLISEDDRQSPDTDTPLRFTWPDDDDDDAEVEPVPEPDAVAFLRRREECTSEAVHPTSSGASGTHPHSPIHIKLKRNTPAEEALVLVWREMCVINDGLRYAQVGIDAMDFGFSLGDPGGSTRGDMAGGASSSTATTVSGSGANRPGTAVLQKRAKGANAEAAPVGGVRPIPRLLRPSSAMRPTGPGGGGGGSVGSSYSAMGRPGTARPGTARPRTAQIGGDSAATGGDGSRNTSTTAKGKGAKGDEGAGSGWGTLGGPQVSSLDGLFWRKNRLDDASRTEGVQETSSALTMGGDTMGGNLASSLRRHRGQRGPKKASDKDREPVFTMPTLMGVTHDDVLRYLRDYKLKLAWEYPDGQIPHEVRTGTLGGGGLGSSDEEDEEGDGDLVDLMADDADVEAEVAGKKREKKKSSTAKAQARGGADVLTVEHVTESSGQAAATRVRAGSIGSTGRPSSAVGAMNPTPHRPSSAAGAGGHGEALGPRPPSGPRPAGVAPVAHGRRVPVPVPSHIPSHVSLLSPPRSASISSGSETLLAAPPLPGRPGTGGRLGVLRALRQQTPSDAPAT